MSRLLAVLKPQMDPHVQVLILNDVEGAPRLATGHKRNILLAQAQGLYSAFIDDDDLVSADYCPRIIEAIQRKPDIDCVGFNVRRFVDEKLCGQAIHSLKYERFEDLQRGDWWEYHRCPNHLNPVRTMLARQTGFLQTYFGEDRDYAHRLRPLLKTETYIDEYLYDYFLTTHHSITHNRPNPEVI